MGIYKTNCDSELGEYILELGIGTSVQLRRGDDLITVAGDVNDAVEDGRRSGGRSQGTGSPFQGRQAVFKNVLVGFWSRV